MTEDQPTVPPLNEPLPAKPSLNDAAVGRLLDRLIDHRPLILTADMEPSAAAKFEALRRRWFPPERNIVPAHITLFHQLPGSEFDGVVGRLKMLARTTPPPQVEVTGLRSLGRGVAYRLRSPGLDALHAELVDGFGPLLTLQDRQGYRPHLTVQNKVTPVVARATLTELEASFVPFVFRVTGVAVWRYLNGPWEALKTVALRG